MDVARSQALVSVVGGFEMASGFTIVRDSPLTRSSEETPPPSSQIGQFCCVFKQLTKESHACQCLSALPQGKAL